MSKLWKILNAPLVVVLLALAVWPIFTVLSSVVALKLGVEQISETVSQEVVKPFQQMSSEQDQKLKFEFQILEKVVASNIGFAPTSWPGKIKVIGTITNNSDKTVKGIHLSASFLRAGKLVNVNDEWLSRVKAISPGSSVDFNFTTALAEGETTEDLDVSVKVVDLGILE